MSKRGLIAFFLGIGLWYLIHLGITTTFAEPPRLTSLTKPSGIYQIVLKDYV